ncbi:MAG TPA: GxxExxY protein [Gemmatimonadaceae bacterium]|nr:GxxExxY protein [Gemmatimonadaceae bacterium]
MAKSILWLPSSKFHPDASDFRDYSDRSYGRFGVEWRGIDDFSGGSSGQVAEQVFYKGDHVAEQRLDMVVDRKLVVETKSTHELHKSANRQVYNYLRSTNLEVGLLLHFGPEARFYRVVHRNKKPHPGNQENPIHPDETSVSVAGLSGSLPSQRAVASPRALFARVVA